MKSNSNAHNALRRKRHVRANAGDKRQYGDVVVRFWRERRDWGDSREIVESPVYVDDYGDLWVDTGSGLARLDSVCDGGLEVVTDSENRMSGLWNSMTIDRAIERGLDSEEEVIGMRKSSKRNIVALKRKLAQSGENYGWEIESLIRDGDMDFEWDEYANEDDFNEKVVEYAYDYIDSHLIYTDDIMHLLGLYNGTEATKFFWDTCGENFMDDVLGSIDMHQLWLDLSEENGREALRKARRSKSATTWQFDDSDVAKWIEDAAKDVFDEYLTVFYGNPEEDFSAYDYANEVAERYMAYYADMLAIVAYYGLFSEALTGIDYDYENSAAARFVNDIADRVNELVGEYVENRANELMGHNSCRRGANNRRRNTVM